MGTKYPKSMQEGYVNVEFTGQTPLDKEDIVEIVGDYTVAQPAAAGSIKLVGGVVIPCDTANGKVTVGCFGTRLRTMSTTTGAPLVVGAVVLGTDNHILQYNAGVHDSAAIFAIALEADAVGGNEVDVLLLG
jgi:hypothetical protein